MSTYDVAAFDELDRGLAVADLLSQNAQLSAADLITGTPKLAQRFLLILLMEQGSQTYDPAAGCNFLVDMRRGLWRTTADVLQSFHYSLLDVQRQLVAVQTAADPPEERYAAATVLSVTLAGDVVSLNLMLTTQAGTQHVFTATVHVHAGMN